jgi:hypothetical protein
MMTACRSDTPYKSIAAIRAAQVPPRFGQSGTGSISYVFGSLIEKILDLKIKNVTGFKSGRDTDLGLERAKWIAARLRHHRDPCTLEPLG